MSNQPYGYAPEGSQPPPSGEGKTKVLSMAYNTAAMLCYLLPCLCCANLIFSILWLATEPKESHYVRFHALQGLLLFGVHFIINIIFNVMGVGMDLTAPGDLASFAGQGILAIIQIVIGILFLVLYIVGMVKAYQGQMWKLPVIGDIAEKNS